MIEIFLNLQSFSISCFYQRVEIPYQVRDDAHFEQPPTGQLSIIHFKACDKLNSALLRASSLRLIL